ncbi:MAG TPA: energy transducer TonB [Gammaproteobacteria bacterium]|nr:energy transducer TonB [Gammaproteobacteria bacterium]
MKSSFFTFALLSAMVHAIIIGMQDEWIFSINENHEQGSPIIDVEITSKSNPAPTTNPDRKKTEATTRTPPPKPEKNKKQIITSFSEKSVSDNKITDPEKTPPADRKFVAEKPLQITTPEHLSENQPDQKNTAPRNTHKNNNNEALKTLLNAELEKYFYYPKAAQRKNRQGSVILAFTINSDGEIENIHINKSSGYNILDNAAIKALNKIEANKDFAMALNGNSTELTVPINYRLLNH